MEQIFIDRFVIPNAAKTEFMERMAINRNFIKELRGFLKDEAYISDGTNGGLVCVTIAVWASEAALKNAKELVQAEYQRTGFNMPAMIERLGIRMERGLFTKLEE